MKILLLGKNGQLGWECQRTFACLGEVIACDYPEVDFTQSENLTGLVSGLRPDIIVNAAAYTAVDKAESEPDLAHQINCAAPEALAKAAKAQDAVFIHISTDYVYDGTKQAEYVEEDPAHPLSVYGQTKLDGDLAVQRTGGRYLIFRTSWVYSMRQGGFVTKVLQWAQQQPVLKMVTDQVSGPTAARMLAEAIALVLAQGRADARDYLGERRGVYHLAGSGYASRLEWAQAILSYNPRPDKQLAREILPALTADFPTPAQRPLHSILDCSHFERTFGFQLPPWKKALQLIMQID